MPAASTAARVGLPIAAGVLALAAVFAWRQWVERRTRQDDLSEEDRAYFARKDVRRLLGTTILVLIASGMFVGLSIDPGANRAAGQAFVWVWFGVAVLLCVSLVVALIDWTANLGYARRQRKGLIEARRAILEEEIRLRAAPRNGQAGPRGPIGEPPQR